MVCLGLPANIYLLGVACVGGKYTSCFATASKFHVDLVIPVCESVQEYYLRM